MAGHYLSSFDMYIIHHLLNVNVKDKVRSPLVFSFYLRPIQDIHIHFGRVKGMSTRAGTSVLLHDLLEEARGRVEETMKNTSS